MYGYVVPPKQIAARDHALFGSFYCGLCIRTGKLMGQWARLTTNYDMTFLSVLLHDLMGEQVGFEAKSCVLNPLKKRPIVCGGELLDKIVAVDVILAYKKAEDGVLDGEGVKYRLIRRSLSKAYEASRRMLPEVDEIVTRRYYDLRRLEAENCKGLDRVSDVFASMMRDVGSKLLGDKACEDSLALIYNIGKFVYLADALDDIDEDHRAERYNPFLSVMPYDGRKAFFEQNEEAISFALNVTANRAIECFNNLRFTQSYDLLCSIVHVGLRQKISELMTSKKKLPKPKV